MKNDKSDIKKEIKKREKLEELINDHIFHYNFQIEKLNKDISKVAGQGTKIEELPEWINEAKKEITTFTFELISIVIGLLSLILAITVLWINKGGIDITLISVYIGLGIAFIVLFAIFVHSWRKKNFPKVKGANLEEIISYINSKIESNNSDMSDYIKDEISKCCEYTDGKIGEVAEFIKKNKNKK